MAASARSKAAAAKAAVEKGIASGDQVHLFAPRASLAPWRAPVRLGRPSLACEHLLVRVEQDEAARAMVEHLLPIERDGVVENLFEFLRTRSAAESHIGGRFKAFRVPDTVLFRNGMLYRWYFTSAKDGTIMRRNRARCAQTKTNEDKRRQNTALPASGYWPSATGRARAD